MIRSDEWFTPEIAASLGLDRDEVQDVVIYARQGSYLRVDVTKYVANRKRCPRCHADGTPEHTYGPCPDRDRCLFPADGGE